MTNQNNQTAVDVQKKKAELDARLSDIGWAVLLITIGTIWLLPEKQAPQGSWLIAAGLILLGINVIRYVNGIRMSGFSLVLGTLALVAGIGALFAWNLPLFAVALIVIGACMLSSRWLKNDPFPLIGRVVAAVGVETRKAQFVTPPASSAPTTPVRGSSSSSAISSAVSPSAS